MAHATKARITTSSTICQADTSGLPWSWCPIAATVIASRPVVARPPAMRSASRGLPTRQAANTQASSTTIGQNQTIDASGACHTVPESEAGVPSIRSGMLHRPT